MILSVAPPGAAVRLRGGGPLMVVLGVTSEEDLLCGWWDAGQEMCGLFHPRTVDVLAMGGPLDLDE